MEAAKIDWKNIDSVFIVDQVFENINAPQWVDFIASPSSSTDDVAWFCRPDCRHPTCAEDFLNSKTPPSSSKLLRSVSVSKLIGLGDWRTRDATTTPTNLKRRGAANQFSGAANVEDSENQNPNLSTPYHYHKAGIKSSANKDDYSEIMLQAHQKSRLKPTRSAKDLFGGRDFFGKITDFCNELKKMAATARVKEGEDDKVPDDQLIAPLNSNHSYKPLGFSPTLGVKDKQGTTQDILGSQSQKNMNDRKPLLEVQFEAGGLRNGKGKLKKNMRNDDAENIPVSLDLNNVKRNADMSPIRMNPPTPQGFSASRDPVKATPWRGPKSKLKEREMFQELGQNKTLREELDENENASLVAAKEGRALDVFWFLKPCTLSS